MDRTTMGSRRYGRSFGRCTRHRLPESAESVLDSGEAVGGIEAKGIGLLGGCLITIVHDEFLDYQSLFGLRDVIGL